MTTRRKFDRDALRETLRKRFPGGPREALRKLGLDESLLDVPRLALDGANPMPTRLEYLAVTRAAAAINPLLAMDKKVEYGPIFKGLTTKNFPKRKPVILDSLKKALTGNTVAKDATMEHVAHMLDQLEHVDGTQLDESVSGAQHRAMEAAAHGHSNIGIPKEVGEEFEEKDKGKSFDEMLDAWGADRNMSADDIEALKKMHEDSMPDNALDEREDEEKRKAEDEETEREKRANESEAERIKEREKREKEGGKDKRMAGDKKFITLDEAEKMVKSAVDTARKSGRQLEEARAFVRPFVGEVSIALDSAEAVHRAAAKAMGIEDADTVHASALPILIKQFGKTRIAADERRDSDYAADSAGGDGFDSRWGDVANRIGNA